MPGQLSLAPARTDTDRGQTPPSQPRTQLLAEQNVHQLGVAVPGGGKALAAWHWWSSLFKMVELLKVQSSLRGETGADHDQPGRRGLAEPVQQQAAQQEVAQVIDAGVDLEVLTGLHLLVHGAPDSGVTNQTVNAGIFLQEVSGKLAD